MKPRSITYICCSLNLVPILYISSEIFVTGAIIGLSRNEVLESKICGYIIWTIFGTLIADIVTVLFVVCSWSIWQIAFSSYLFNIIAKILSWYSLITTVIPSGLSQTHDNNMTICTTQPFFDALSTITYIIVAMSIVMIIGLSIASFMMAGRTDKYSEIVLI